MHEESPKINNALLPLSFLFGLVVDVRNKLFDWGILKSESFDIPVICVGNLTVGGTGKTPHTEYLVSILHKKYTVAVLSRGYKRETQGFVLANKDTLVKEIGDEPFQIKQKFSNIMVAVCEDRRIGIRTLMDMNPKLDVVILDDAFQHRYVKPGLSILLMDYNRKIYEDKLLPAGRLREPLWAKERSNIMIVTKCPVDTKPMDIRITSKYLEPRPHQSLFFSSIHYGDMIPLFAGGLAFGRRLSDINKKTETVLLVTGIASTRKLVTDLLNYVDRLEEIKFPDHHNFEKKDLDLIEQTFNQIKSPEKMILVTEKDAVRLQQSPYLSESLKKSIFYLRIEIKFLENKRIEFNEKIYEYVRTHQRNSKLSEERS
ncbi:MAG: tetraacyldisaccharide 4'-kinase [Bacteroidales bacterium]|nr:tetraacyldisaccharide 4'-kinase [Bacteroidales bacterium]